MPEEASSMDVVSRCTSVTFTWEGLAITIVVGTLIYILARSVFDTIFFVILAIILFAGIVWAYLRCCAGSSSKSDDYQAIPTDSAAV